MSLNFFKLYAIHLLITIAIILPLLFLLFVSMPSLDSKYSLIPIFIGIILAPKIKTVSFQSGKELQLNWFGKILKKLPY